MTGLGRSGGAGTIVNAMATQRGAAFGLGFLVEARLRTARSWSVYANGRRVPQPTDRVALTAARLVQRQAVLTEAWRIDVTSDIPPERGLKSSSAVAVAVARAALDHLGLAWGPTRILEVAAQAGIDAGVSVTGAFDDAAACLLGGVCITDNEARRLVRRGRLPPGLLAIVHVPRRRLPTRRLLKTDFTGVRPFATEAWDLALRNEIRAAMLLNTLAYAPLLGHDISFTRKALALGAWTAGLSGKGPAEVALAKGPALDRIRNAFPDALVVPVRKGAVP